MLLEFEAFVDAVDGRELTPLYHCVLLGSDVEVAKMLLAIGAKCGTADPQGWNEIHQVKIMSLYGALEHFYYFMVIFKYSQLQYKL